MERIFPILTGIKNEMETMNSSLSKMIKTHTQYLSEEWQRKDKALKILGISSRTLCKLMSTGQLPYSKINGLTFFRTADIETLLRINYTDSTLTDIDTTLKTKNNDRK